MNCLKDNIVYILVSYTINTFIIEPFKSRVINSFLRPRKTIFHDVAQVAEKANYEGQLWEMQFFPGKVICV